MNYSSKDAISNSYSVVAGLKGGSRGRDVEDLDDYRRDINNDDDDDNDFGNRRGNDEEDI